MKQKCIKCKQIFEPSKEDEVAQIGVIKRNGLTPEVLCDMLSLTFGQCADGDSHLTTYDDEDRRKVAKIITDYDEEKAKLENIRKKANELGNNEKDLLNQLMIVRKEVQDSTRKIVDSEEKIKTVLCDYEAMTNTDDIEFYRTVKIETKDTEVK